MKKAIVISLSLVTLTGICSIYQIQAVPYIVILAVIGVTILVTMDKIDSKYIPIYIMGLSLSLLWQTSMLGFHVVGTDVHTEYYVAQRAISNGWDLSLSNNNNTSWVLGLFAPLLNKIGISLTWQFKAIFPFIYSFTPMVLYFTYKRMITDKQAYFACLFIMIMPMFSMEMTSMAKSLVSQMLLSVALYLIVTGIKSWKKMALASVILTASILAHYTVGMMLLIYIVIAVGILGFARLVRLGKYLGERQLQWRYLYTTCLVAIIAVFAWYGTVGNGSMLKHVYAVGENLYNITTTTFFGDSASASGIEGNIVNNEAKETNNLKEVYLKRTQPVDNSTYLHEQPQLVRTAIGLDFSTASISGKVFRIFQYITQLLLISGLAYMFLRVKKYKFTAEYQALVLAGFLLLGCCVFVPFFSTIASTTRWYNTALLFIAPMLIIGFEGINHIWERKRISV